jgi:hypothetical protein
MLLLVRFLIETYLGESSCVPRDLISLRKQLKEKYFLENVFSRDMIQVSISDISVFCTSSVSSPLSHGGYSSAYDTTVSTST